MGEAVKKEFRYPLIKAHERIAHDKENQRAVAQGLFLTEDASWADIARVEAYQHALTQMRDMKSQNLPLDTPFKIGEEMFDEVVRQVIALLTKRPLNAEPIDWDRMDQDVWIQNWCKAFGLQPESMKGNPDNLIDLVVRATMEAQPRLAGGTPYEIAERMNDEFFRLDGLNPKAKWMDHVSQAVDTVRAQINNEPFNRKAAIKILRRQIQADLAAASQQSGNRLDKQA